MAMTGKLKTTKLKTAKKATKQTPKKAAAPQPFKSRFEPDATVIWTGKENPFREGSGAWTRTEIVRKNSGQKVSSVQSKDGMRGTTLATLARMELIKVAG
jgi:hypothetical protein